MPVDSLVGQDVIDLTNARLSGYQNAVSQDDLLGFINEAKDTVWSILKALNEQYFLIFSQATVSLDHYYFAPLSTSVREYTLPADFREIKFIECTTEGFSGVKFVYREPTDEDFRSARRGANDGNAPTVNPDTMLYTIIGKNQFVLAEYPPATVTLKLWYIRSLPDFEASDPVDEILYPYSKKIADYAAKRVLLATQDIAMFSAYAAQWREDVIEVAQGAGPRNQADAQFVQGLFEGDDY